MQAISRFRVWRPARRPAADLVIDCRGIAAVEFAIIAPLMLLMFFGVIEIASGVAVDRKVSLVARTLTDLTGQASADTTPPPGNQNTATIYDSDLLTAFNASASILQPYLATPETARISEIYVDSSAKATVTWSKAATFASNGAATLQNSSRQTGDNVTSLLPPSLLAAKQTYVIFSEVGYTYTPSVGYVISASVGVTLSDVAYTRPRQVQCLVYTSLPVVPALPAQSPCPTP
jgi:Flp pilus assembly protein TadG